MNWEYKVREIRPNVHGPLEDFLNEVGADGWELVSHERVKDYRPTDENHGHGYRDMSQHFLIFKRIILG